ncbi:MAG: class B sortase [Oscillospiraceae bacterium]|nr:class B sortase [Oscillospiraceae bacterium]
MKPAVYSICFMLIAFSIFNIWTIKKSTSETTALYSSLAEIIEEPSEDSDLDLPDDIESGSPKPVLNQWIEKLKLENGETVGWIRIPNTRIDYPVMQTKDDTDFYLSHDFKGNSEKHGVPFVDVKCRVNSSDNLIIYGHHMNDGTMFQNLMKYREAQFCEGNDYIQLFTLQQNRVFEPVYVLVISAKESEDFPYYDYVDFHDKQRFSDFLNGCEKYSVWKNSNPPEYGDTLLTLSTCEYTKENGRLVVISKEIIS